MECFVKAFFVLRNAIKLYLALSFVAVLLKIFAGDGFGMRSDAVIPARVLTEISLNETFFTVYSLCVGPETLLSQGLLFSMFSNSHKIKSALEMMSVYKMCSIKE